MPVGMMPEPPGSEADEAAARGHRTRSRSAEVIGGASFHDGTGLGDHLIINGDNVKDYVAPIVTSADGSHATVIDLSY